MMRAAQMNVLRAGLSLFLLACLGCNGASDSVKFANATGTVTFQGNPLSGANVMAYPEKGPVATAITDAQGRFTLSSGPDQPGVAQGPVKVAVTKNKSSASAPPAAASEAAAGEEFVNPMQSTSPMQSMYEGKSREEIREMGKIESEIPTKYADPETSGLSFEIKDGDNDLPIALE